MKTQVFHYFREIGNGLIFVQLIERALNQQEMHDMIQAAPFRRQFPRIHIKEGERYESKERFKNSRSKRDLTVGKVLLSLSERHFFLSS